MPYGKKGVKMLCLFPRGWHHDAFSKQEKVARNATDEDALLVVEEVAVF